MKVGDKVLLTGKIIKIVEDGEKMNYLIAFEYKTKKTFRFIEYWFSDVFLSPHPKKEEEVGEECYCDLGSPNKEVCPIHSKDTEDDIGIGPNSVGEYLVGPDKLDKGGEE